VGSPGRLIGALFVVASSTQCRLLTDQVNEAPKVEMRLTSPDTITRGQAAAFSATAHDPDEDPARLRVQWFTRDRGDCPAALAEARAATEMPASEGPTFMKTPAKLGPFCVWVVVTDSDGARAFDGDRFEVVNGMPKAVIDLVTPAKFVATTPPTPVTFPLFSEVRFSAAMSNDPERDPLSYRWMWQPPAGEPQPAACDPAGSPSGDEVKCWRFERAGEYELQLRVKDSAETWSEPDLMKVMVLPDRPPCIQRTEPPHGLDSYVTDPAEPLTFRLLDVDDDGDPFPTVSGGPPTGEVVWRYLPPGGDPEKPGDWQRFSSTSMTTLGFARNKFRYGDVVHVQLDYRDRDPAHDPAVNCEKALTCPAQGQCRQRVHWKVSLL
jgi:hypothetical protein